jgi:S-adenosylmethionine:tRNA ribosyltransferase-isomerase
MTAPLLAPILPADPLDFELPDDLVASDPPEARGRAREDVAMLVSDVAEDRLTHARFSQLPELLTAGDLLVVNASATVNAALVAWREPSYGRSAERIALHLSSPVPGGRVGWRVVELRRITAEGTLPLLNARAGERLRLAHGAWARLAEPFRRGQTRLWVAQLVCPGGVATFAAEHGSPIRYRYGRRQWPLAEYQTIFASEPGSAEMPSAGRPFTAGIIDRLERKGVRIASLVLHTGVSSLESHEPPYPERYRVPASTADAVNRTRAAGGRVVAVGTTVVRALETVAARNGKVRAGEGWTDLVVTPERGVLVTDALLTGLHEPRSSHLAMLESLAGRSHLATAYRAARDRRYLWHEFGDLHLILK